MKIAHIISWKERVIEFTGTKVAPEIDIEIGPLGLVPPGSPRGGCGDGIKPESWTLEWTGGKPQADVDPQRLLSGRIITGWGVEFHVCFAFERPSLAQGHVISARPCRNPDSGAIIAAAFNPHHAIRLVKVASGIAGEDECRDTSQGGVETDEVSVCLDATGQKAGQESPGPDDPARPVDDPLAPADLG